MKLILAILSATLFFASCSTAYRSGQTPDDVYYSPERPQNEEYVRVNNRNDRQYQGQSNRYNANQYDDRYGYEDDRYLRMRVRNPRMWSDLDFYYNDPFAFNYYSPYRVNNYFGIYSVHPYAYSYYNPYSFWNNNFNPYYSPYYGNYNRYGKVIVGTPQQVYNRPRTSNLNIYNNNSTAPANSSRNAKPRTYRVNNNENSNRRNSGDNMRDVFGNSNRNTNRTYDNNSNNNSSRMSTPSNNSSNSNNNSNRSSGGSAPARRF